MNLSGNKFKLAAFHILYAVLTCLGILTVTVVILKKIVGRERPTKVASKSRICNMRDREHGKSMPSGDSAAAAFLLSLYFWFFGVYWPMLMIPLVMLGRVYVFCHWFGDTIIGSLMGLAVCHFFYTPE